MLSFSYDVSSRNQVIETSFNSNKQQTLNSLWWPGPSYRDIHTKTYLYILWKDCFMLIFRNRIHWIALIIKFHCYTSFEFVSSSIGHRHFPFAKASIIISIPCDDFITEAFFSKVKIHCSERREKAPGWSLSFQVGCIT